MSPGSICGPSEADIEMEHSRLGFLRGPSRASRDEELVKPIQ